MGRVRNAKLDQQHELEEQLAELRQQLSNKEAEFLNFEIRDHLDSLRGVVDILTRRIEILENNASQQRLVVEDANKNNNTANSRLFSLITMLTAISAIYYKYRH